MHLHWCFVFLVLCMVAFGATGPARADTVAGSEQQTAALNPVMFNPRFFNGHVDVERFAQSATAQSGIYRVDVYLNQNWVGRRDMEIRSASGYPAQMVCVDAALLTLWGVDIDAVKANDHGRDKDKNKDKDKDKSRKNADNCKTMETLVPLSSARFSLAQMRVDLAVPQRYMRRVVRGSVDSEEWDQGINAGFLNYAVNFSRRSTSPVAALQHRNHASLNMGLNLGGWRLRNWTSYSHATSSGSSMPADTAATKKITTRSDPHWQRILSYAQHDVTWLKSQLTIGETSSADAHLMDGFNFIGMQLSSDDRMQPNQLRSYAPIIRGIADTPARISIRQGGMLIHELMVAPGEFLIDDLLLHSGAELEVTIHEADGRQKQFYVTAISGSLMLRPGVMRYALALGRLRGPASSYRPLFGRFSYHYGLENGITVYAGSTLARRYQAGMLGLAFGTGVGAFSIDLTQSRINAGGIASRCCDRCEAGHGDSVLRRASDVCLGQRWRASFTSQFRPTQSRITIFAEYYPARFSDRFVASVTDHATGRAAGRATGRATDHGTLPFAASHYADLPRAARWLSGDVSSATRQLRSRVQVMLYQPVVSGIFRTTSDARPSGNYGSLYLNGVLERHQRHAFGTSSYYIGYSRAFSSRYHWGNLTLSLGRSRDASGRYVTQFFAGLQFPLGPRGHHQPTLATQYSTTHHDDRSSGTALLSGSAGNNRQFRYNVNAGYQLADRTATGDAGTLINYASQRAQFSASVSKGASWEQGAVGMSGGVLAHSEGLLAQANPGETMVIVKADKMGGASVVGSGGGGVPIKINRAGYALIPHLSPYRRNEVHIDPKGSSPDVELDSTSRHVIPRAGAIVRLKFTSSVGKAVLITASRTSGSGIPMGASVVHAVNNEVIGHVAQGGRIYSRKLQDRMPLQVRWGKGLHQQCRIDVVLQEQVDVSQGEETDVTARTKKSPLQVESHRFLQKVALPCVAQEPGIFSANLVQ